MWILVRYILSWNDTRNNKKNSERSTMVQYVMVGVCVIQTSNVRTVFKIVLQAEVT